MNILYISNLEGEICAGQTYSIPAQITAQAKIDNVLWYNTKKEENSEWRKLRFYKNLRNFPTGRIKDLPVPFNKPDLIIIEGFYSIIQNKIILEIILGKIPYIIIPRGELTRKAQNRKYLKKMIANLLICNKFAKKALAIEFLTEQEQKDAKDKWNRTPIILPNGIDLVNETKTIFSENGIICSYIGRIEPYQKGLDLLIKSSVLIKDELIKNNVKINLYGPDVDKKLKELQKIVEKYKLQTIFYFYPGVYGEQKQEILLKSDIFIMTSRFEGHPMALIEALSLGLPVFITKGTNMKEEVETFNAGWTSETTEEDIARTFLKILNEKTDLIKISSNAKKLAKLYSWNAIAQKSHILYENLLEKRRKV